MYLRPGTSGTSSGLGSPTVWVPTGGNLVISWRLISRAHFPASHWPFPITSRWLSVGMLVLKAGT